MQQRTRVLEDAAWAAAEGIATNEQLQLLDADPIGWRRALERLLDDTEDQLEDVRQLTGPERDQVVADFDFRITPGTGRADGLGFALLNTANYGNGGAQAPPNAAEEPNFLGSLGVGFDVYPHPGEPSDNHVSIHYNGALVRAFDARPALDLAIGQWIHARIIMRPGGGYSDVSVILSQCGLAPVTLVDRLKVSGLTPYEGRAYIAARSGGYAADHDVDNVGVKFLGLNQGVFAFSTGCSSAIEHAGAVELTIGRTGSLSDAATVKYATAAASAAGGDFQPASGTLAFAPGEATKTIAVRPADDNLEEDDESFVVLLSEAAGAALGGPTAYLRTLLPLTAIKCTEHMRVTRAM